MIGVGRSARAAFGPAVLLALIVTAASGVHAAQKSASAEPSQALRDRVTKYWTARSQSNLVAAYPFYEPDFRAEYPLEQFLSSFQRLMRFRPQFRGIEGIALESSRKVATVKVQLRTQPEFLNGAPLDSVSEETWLQIDGVWYRQRESTTMSF
jgi:hypothetical protein